jgi:hypothetical protein
MFIVVLLGKSHTKAVFLKSCSLFNDQNCDEIAKANHRNLSSHRKLMAISLLSNDNKALSHHNLSSQQ